jgi:uncharacterized protein (UPF0264 family)
VLAKQIDCEGLLIDTYHKSIGMGLLDYYSIEQIATFVEDLYGLGKEAWIAGSISREEIHQLWATNVGVMCVRSAACFSSDAVDRFGNVQADIVRRLLPR